MISQVFDIPLIQNLDFCFVYLVILLGRCVLASYLTLPLILLLRKTWLNRAVFAKGMLWCLFLPTLFVGKLRAFYEQPFLLRRFFWWHNLCIEESWICWLYIAGIVCMGGYFVYRRLRLEMLLRDMKKTCIGDTRVFVWDKSITPFTTGLIVPKIAIPAFMVNTYAEKELQTILLHEKTHIRLGHLWFYLLWEILCCLLWLNPLLLLSTRYFQEDLEQICDRVVIQKNNKNAYDYGRLLLKSLRILKEKARKGTAAFAGEQSYLEMKSRIEQVADFQTYTVKRVVLCVGGFGLLLAGVMLGIHAASYPVYMEYTGITICSPDFHLWQIGKQEELSDAIIIGETTVSIHRDAWEEILAQNGIDEDIYYIYFGGYSKLPGIGGGGNGLIMDNEIKGDLIIPYVDSDRTGWSRFLKWM